MARRVISCEDDAWEMFGRSLAHDAATLDDDRISFDHWPSLRVNIDPGDGVVTPEMMRAHASLQRAVHRCYAILKYDTADVRRLTAQDRYSLRLSLAVEKGSTKFKIDFSRVLEACFQAAFPRMNGAQAMRTVLGLGMIVGTSVTISAWLYFHSTMHNKQLEVATQLTLSEHHNATEVRKEELRLQAQRELVSEIRAITDNGITQMRLLRAAYERSNLLQFAASDYLPWRPALLDVAPYTGTITINDVTLAAPVAKKMAKIARKAGNGARKEIAGAKGPPIISANWVTTVTPAGRLEPPMRLGA